MEIEKKEDNEGSRAIPLSIRWRIIGFLDAGKKWQEAADFFKISKGTVSKIYKKFIDTGTVDNKPRKGRPKKVRTAGKAEIANWKKCILVQGKLPNRWTFPKALFLTLRMK